MSILKRLIVMTAASVIGTMSQTQLLAQEHSGTTLATRNALTTNIPADIREFSVNGVQVILRPAGALNRVVAVKLFIRGGLVALPANVSPAVEDLALDVPVLSGPQGMTKSNFRRVTDRMVTRIDAATGRDFSLMNMRCVDEQFDASWNIFAGIVMRPQFDEVELRNSKQRTLVGIRNRLVNPESYCNYIADSVYFAGHPYGRDAQESEIDGITVQVLENYRKQLLVKSRLLLVIVGNVDSADLYKKVSASLGTLPQGSYTETPLPLPRNAGKPILIVRPPLSGQRTPTNYIVARYPAPGRQDSLYYPMLRLTSFLSGSLFREVRIDRNLSYAPDADVSFGKASYGEISISTTLPDSAWRVSKHEVIDFFRDNIIADRFMKSGIASWTTNTYIRQQTSASQATELGLAQIYTGSWKRAFGVVEGMRNVSPEAMNEAARRYVRNMTVVIIGDPKAVTPKEYLPAGMRVRSSGKPGVYEGSVVKGSQEGSDAAIDWSK